jgi:hypothetical protein
VDLIFRLLSACDTYQVLHDVRLLIRLLLMEHGPLYNRRRDRGLHLEYYLFLFGRSHLLLTLIALDERRDCVHIHACGEVRK